MAEPTTRIEVTGKRGKCIRCSRPGRRRRINARYNGSSENVHACYCIRCANEVARQLKWNVRYAARPVCCQGTVDLGLSVGDTRSGPVGRHHHSQ